MSILCSVSAYGDYADENKRRMLPEQGFDFDIKLDAQDIRLLGLVDNADDVHLLIRMQRTGYFEDMLFSIRKGMSYSKIPLSDEQIAVSIGISDMIGCSDIRSVASAEKLLCDITRQQPDHDVILFAGYFYNEENNVFDGYKVSVYRNGVCAIERSEDMILNRSEDWHACPDADPALCSDLIQAYKMRDCNADDPDFAESQAASVMDTFREVMFDSIRDAMCDADVPIGVNLYGSHAHESDYQFASAIGQLSALSE